MIEKLLQIAAPHHCYGCGNVGSALCENCKYDITSEPFSGCIVCSRLAIQGICGTCRAHYNKAWCVAERSGVIENILNAYKFERVKSAHRDFAMLLSESLPLLPYDTVVVPLPTIRSHVRIRGYDHTLLIAKDFAKQRNIRIEQSLKRTTNHVQRGATRKERFQQAEKAYECTTSLSSTTPYLLVDDVVTTGASVQYAAKTLYDAGAREIWVAVIARQPLDKNK